MIDQRSGIEAVGDLDKFLKFEMGKGLGTAGGPAAAGSALGMGAGVGVMMPAMLSKVFAPDQLELRREPVATVTCPTCHTDTPEQSRFCYRCGHAMVMQNLCPSCRKELPTETVPAVSEATARPEGERVAIVMPAYNAARTIEETFRAIPEGYYDEIVVVDDHSRDDTVARARALQLKATALGLLGLSALVAGRRRS